MLVISGLSDDIVEILTLDGDLEITTHGDEIDCFGQDVDMLVGMPLSGVAIRWRYKGTWSVEIERPSAGVDFPWVVKVEANGSCNITVVIECPDDTPVSHDVVKRTA